ncbi:hypothetical protein TNCV_4484021 [Trichonephila clavipes]|nr:hypothetical protein TNCV_4484021 [Trichonephila clavipes]
MRACLKLTQRTRSSTFHGRCNRLPIISQTGYIEERSGDLDGQRSVWLADQHTALGVFSHVFDDRQDTYGNGIRRHTLYVSSQYDSDLISSSTTII